MDVKTFVMLTVASFFRTATNDDKTAGIRPPDVVCAEIEKTATKQRAACTYTSTDGADVTIYVFVERPAKVAPKR